MVSVTFSTKLLSRINMIAQDRNSGSHTLARSFATELDQFSILFDSADPIVDVLIVAQIAVRWPAVGGDFRMVLSGSGIGPVSSLDALGMAIGDGLATGGASVRSRSRRARPASCRLRCHRPDIS